jgi:hypothetical protein
MKRILFAIAICGLLGRAAETDKSATNTNVSPDGIAPGTVITMANWQNYRDFMPSGLIALFGDKYFWRMPADIRIEASLHLCQRFFPIVTRKGNLVHAAQGQEGVRQECITSR